MTNPTNTIEAPDFKWTPPARPFAVLGADEIYLDWPAIEQAAADPKSQGGRYARILLATREPGV